MSEKEEFDVFISYNWDTKDKVKKLHEKLKNEGLKVWRDDTEMEHNNSPLTEQLAQAIKKSKIFLSCITQKYSESKNCKLEFQYANDINKIVVILFLDRLKIEELGGIGFVMSGLVRINCYKHPDTWFDEDFDEILKSINQNLKDLDKKNQVDDQTIKGQYKLIKKLGEGSEAVVFKIEDLNDKKTKYKALKQFKNINLSNNRLIEKEVELMKKVDNQNIIKYLDFFYEKVKYATIYFILTDYYEDGTLDEEIALQRATKKPLAFHDIISWSSQLLNGIQYLHDHDEQIIHRDIKPENIFLSGRKLVLGDLGHAKSLAQNVGGKKSKTSRNLNFGTDNYIAPEIIELDDEYTQKVDIWSYGCVLYEMIKLKKLFDGGSSREIERKIQKFKNQDLMSKLISSNVSPILVNVLKCSLVNNPKERLTAKELDKVLKGEKVPNLDEKENNLSENAEITELKSTNSIKKKSNMTQNKRSNTPTLPRIPSASSRPSSSTQIDSVPSLPKLDSKIAQVPSVSAIASSEEKREIICLHIGQAGTKIGTEFWNLLSNEHGIDRDGRMKFKKNFTYHPFFSQDNTNKLIPRTLFIDTDPSLINHIRKYEFKNLLNPNQFVTDREECGLYTKRYSEIGRRLKDNVLNSLRQIIEETSNIQGFFIFNGISGGCSGLKNNLIEDLSSQFSKSSIFDMIVLPSQNFTTNVAEIYNATLALNQNLTSCSILFENEAIFKSCLSNGFKSEDLTFKNINKIIAECCSRISSSLRFDSTLNKSMDEIYQNLVRSQNLNHIFTTYSHINSSKNFLNHNQLMDSLFDENNKLISCKLGSCKFSNVCALFRGKNVNNDEVEKVMFNFKNKQEKDCQIDLECKTGIVKYNQYFNQSEHNNMSACLMSSGTFFTQFTEKLVESFDLIYEKKSFLDEYINDGIDLGEFTEARENFISLNEEYNSLFFGKEEEGTEGEEGGVGEE
ncbi:unnamed protein product [Brachionus calyciflorus]|uniref:Protein kinase domain-containing protein n=1 Tax=Brachionus calyciflorus TaxID=104777 RepID=A0A814AF74_9BILA|nr:unnamed protein product [Brachionus calyciflorus]